MHWQVVWFEGKECGREYEFNKFQFSFSSPCFLKAIFTNTMSTSVRLLLKLLNFKSMSCRLLLGFLIKLRIFISFPLKFMGVCVCKFFCACDWIVGQKAQSHLTEPSIDSGFSENSSSQPHSLSSLASSQQQLALSQCSGALSIVRLNFSSISFQGQCWAWTPSNPALQRS